MLTDIVIRAAKASGKPRKLFDEKGLFLRGKKEKLLALGIYPEVSLKDARAERDDAWRDLRSGIDPAVKRRAEEHSPSNTFEAVALELFEMLRKASLAGVNPSSAAAEAVEPAIQPQRKQKVRCREPISVETIDTMHRRLETHVFPYIGATDVSVLAGPDVLGVLRRIESRGTFELAHRTRSICSRVLRYGRATDRKCEDVPFFS
jgi:Arm DNA-binding domain